MWGYSVTVAGVLMLCGSCKKLACNEEGLAQRLVEVRCVCVCVVTRAPVMSPQNALQCALT